jgi:glucosamine-6-phosphate deaminase
MKEYYSIPAEKFCEHSPIRFNFVHTHEEMCQIIAQEIVDLIKTKSSQGEMTKLILPVGPIDYTYLAQLCNQRGVSCESLVIFSMDEYCYPDGSAIPMVHPLSFRAFYQRTLMDVLDDDKMLPPDQLILPDPADLEMVQRKMEQYGQIDITYAGFGINGHIAFNSPPREKMDVESFRNTTTRILELREGDMVQMAMGGTAGNLEIIPPKAVTLGLKELLSARKMHLTFMRSWHAGVMRRALFGPVTAEFPGSLVQLHDDVCATVTDLAAALPPFSLLQSPGK